MKNNLLLTMVLCLSIFQNSKPDNELIESSKIVGLSIGAAITYGIINDQFSARFCPEYFSEGFHKNMRNQWRGPVMGRLKTILENTQSPTTVAIIWGTVATWWMGGLLSIPVLLASRLGSLPKLTAEDLLAPTGVALAGMGAASLLAGIQGYKWATSDEGKQSIHRLDWVSAAGRTKEENLNKFIAAGHAHQMAYGSGAAAGLGLAMYAFGKRYFM